MAGDGGRVPDVSEQRAEIEAVMRALVESEHAPHYGSEHCVCGPQATPADDCPVHWAIAVVERLQDAARVRDARGDDEKRSPTTLGLPTKRECGVATQDLGEPLARSPQGESDEAAIPSAVLAEMVERFRFVVATKQQSPDATAESAVEVIVEPLLPFLSRSRDGTVAVEDVAEWLRVRAGRTHDNGASSALYAAARDLRAEFGPARAGESNEGGNQ